jgi:CheY-like chemotaxis protein
LIDDLLDVSRITRGKIELRRNAVELKVILENAVQTCRPLIEAREHEFSVSLTPQPIWLDADQTRLEQVMVNLLNNAAKYSNHKSKITVTVVREHNQAVLRVRDTGVGIPPDLLPHIFDMFTQADRSLDRSQGGLGIGLTLVQKLVELHEGSVRASSEGVGRGSEFVVTLPVLDDRPKAASVENAARAPEKAEKPLRVVVVDDNVDSAESLRTLLAMSGHDVLAIHSGLTAPEAAREHRPHVMLLDIGLPGLNGYQVAERLRETPDLKDIVLVALTGYGQEEDRWRSMQAGFDYHLVKPVDPHQLGELLTLIGRMKQS